MMHHMALLFCVSVVEIVLEWQEPMNHALQVGQNGMFLYHHNVYRSRETMESLIELLTNIRSATIMVVVSIFHCG